ncbi:MAG: UDP-glucose/GDP-mannose dehydrogenase family protein [Patescibacteria group bacterium]|jgi:UDPglucose 6-dehydrogenase
MKISVIGIGYVGLVTATCFAELGNTVTCVDIDKNRIENLKKGIIPIYEPGLSELVKKNIKQKRIIFTTSTKLAVQNGKVIFIAVGTPSDKDGQADLKYVKQVAKEIALSMDGYRIIVNKSTVPVGTGDIVKGIIQKKYKGNFSVVSNPEFLREGSAIYDTMNPDRVVIGNGDDKARKIMEELYRPFKAPIVFTDVKSAELIKYASNSMLATQISFINSLANICEKVGADVDFVAEGMKLDKRIGKHSFLSAGGGYGGSCFPKDVKALIKASDRYGYNFSILKAVEDVNDAQKRHVVTKTKKLIGSLKGKKIGIWGLAFKPHTDDMRESISIVVIDKLLQEGVKVKAFDPVAQDEARKIFKDKITYCADVWETVKDVDALIILTEWPEFKEIDLFKLKKIMDKPYIMDARNIFTLEEMEEKGFHYLSIGR